MQQLKEVMERGSRSAVQQVVRWEDVSRDFKSAKLGMPCDFPTSLTTSAIPDWLAAVTQTAARYVMTYADAVALGRKTKSWLAAPKNSPKFSKLVEFLLDYKTEQGKYFALGPWVVWRLMGMRDWYAQTADKPDASRWRGATWEESVTPSWLWDPKWLIEPRNRGMFRVQMMGNFQARAGLVIWPFAAREAFQLYLQYVAESKDSAVEANLWETKYKPRMDVFLREGEADFAIISNRLRAYRESNKLEVWVSDNPIRDLQLFGIGQCNVSAPLTRKQSDARQDVLRRRHTAEQLAKALGSEKEIVVPFEPRHRKGGQSFGRNRRVAKGSSPRAKPQAPPDSPVVWRSPESKVVEAKPKTEPLPDLNRTLDTGLTQVSTTVVKRKRSA
jgi:hypothetical protein